MALTMVRRNRFFPENLPPQHYVYAAFQPSVFDNKLLQKFLDFHVCLSLKCTIVCSVLVFLPSRNIFPLPKFFLTSHIMRLVLLWRSLCGNVTLRCFAGIQTWRFLSVFGISWVRRQGNEQLHWQRHTEVYLPTAWPDHNGWCISSLRPARYHRMLSNVFAIASCVKAPPISVIILWPTKSWKYFQKCRSRCCCSC